MGKEENLTKRKEAQDRLKAKKLVEKQERDIATAYVENFRNGKGNKYVAIRIRDGYIGKEMTKDGRVLQPYRTRPRGTMVAFKDPNKENELRIGISYLHDEMDKDIPIVGIANAIKYAMEEKEECTTFTGSVSTDKVQVFGYINTNIFHTMSQNDKDLYEFFKIRALCYFYPDIYSHSRGTDKIEYPNYEKIHKNRARVLGE